MSNTPLISMIIPVYNVEKLLPYCLDSIINQTFQDFEVICVNDGSPDNSLEILKRYAEKDSRFKIISQENGGVSSARNKGLECAIGDYICYIDADDYIHPNYLDVLYSFAEHHNADLVNCKFKRVDNYIAEYANIDKKNIESFVYENPILLGCNSSKKNTTYSVWGKLFRRNFITGIKFEAYSIIEDEVYVYAVLSRRPKTVVIESILYFYVMNPLSITHSGIKQKHMYDYCKALWNVINMYKKENLQQEYKVVVETFIPSILKQMRGHCRRAPKEIRKEMYGILRNELHELNKKGLLQRKGHKLKRYLIYKMLIWGMK